MVSNTAKVEFLFDVGSPNAYLSHCVIPAIQARTGAVFEYVPVLLGGIFKATGNQPPGTAFANIKNKLDYEMLEITRFVRRHDIEGFALNPDFPMNTLMVMRGAIAARKLDVFARYVDAMFDTMWRDHRKLDEPEVVMAAMKEAGLPADELAHMAQDPEIKQALIDNTADAVERGAFGAPTFFVDGEIYFGKDRLWQVEQAIGRR